MESRRLLRCVFKVNSQDDAELLYKNALALRQSGVGFPSLTETEVWEFISEFVTQHGHVPLASTLQEAFEGNEGVRDQVIQWMSLKPVYRGDFQKLLASALEAQNRLLTKELLEHALQINSRELVIADEKGKKSTYKGPMDAWKFLTSKMLEVTSPNQSGIRKEGEVTSDTASFVRDYERRRDDPTWGVGQATGIQQLDEVFGGARKGQLWTHAAFTGELKSTLTFNWIYNQAIYFGQDSLSFCLEMSYDQCQRIIYVMHSMHPKFRDIRISLGVQESKEEQRSLEYRYVRDGKLPPSHEMFMTEYVLPDIENPANKYGKMHFRGYDPDKDKFTVADIRAKGEALFRESPFQMLIVDHTLLVDSKRNYNSTTEKANEVVRDLKKLSEVFYHGEGMAVVNLFQISREGKKRADKASGPHKYSLYDLSYSNEIERSSDIVTTSYLNEDLRNRNLALIQGIKGRDDGIVDPFYVSINWSCRRLMNCALDPLEDVDSVDNEVSQFNQADFSSLGF